MRKKMQCTNATKITHITIFKNIKTKKMILATDIHEFTQYCNEFYNIETGIYPVATKKEIIKAVAQHISRTNGKDLHLDSFDREKVREILEPNYKIL